MKQLHALFAAVSKAQTELDASEDSVLLQPLESRLTELETRLHGTRPIAQQVDGLRGVISRCLLRLADVEFAKNVIIVVSGYVSWARPFLSSTS